MFILRRITSEGLESNTSLGDWYNFVSLERNPEEFKRTVELWSTEDLKDVYAVIVYHGGSDIMPLYKKSQYYVMSENGKTFDNLSWMKSKNESKAEQIYRLESGDILLPSSYNLLDCLKELKSKRPEYNEFLNFCIETILSASC